MTLGQYAGPGTKYKNFNKFANGIADTVGSMLGQTFPEIDPQTGDYIAIPDAPNPKADIKATVTKNMKQWLLLTGAGATFGSLVAGDGMVPDAWIGPVPIEIVTYYDFAESDSVVKYRAFGGEYFAHQGGDKNAMRIDFLLVGPYKDIIMNVLRLLRFYSKSQQVGQGLFNTDESFLRSGRNQKKGEALWTVETVKRRRADEVSLNSKGLTKLTYAELMDLGISPDGLSVSYGAGNNINFDETVWNALPETTRLEYFDDPDSEWGKAMAQDPLYQQTLAKQGYSTTRKKDANGNYESRIFDPNGVYSDTNTSQRRNVEYASLVPNKNVDPQSIEKYVFQDQKFDDVSGQWLMHGDTYYELQNMGYYQFHYNYPIIVKNHIFNGMWIETVQFTQEAKNGIDAIQGHLLLRKYIRPPKLRWNASGKNISGLAYKKEEKRYKESTSNNIRIDVPVPLSEKDNDWLIKHQGRKLKGDNRRKFDRLKAQKEKYKDGKIVTNTANKKQDETVNYDLGSYDKKVWVWEEKRDDTPQIAEIVSNVVTGITKAAFTLLANGLTGKGTGASNFMSFQPDSLTQVASRVLV